MKYLRIIFRYVYVAVLPSRQRLVIGHISEGVAPGYYLVVPSRHRSACGVLVM